MPRKLQRFTEQIREGRKRQQRQVDQGIRQ
uniref:Uncharacterized protein n=1 Tax=Rhizophora mucronata TaxID=61149 RepID=A0A2P2PDG6_RHIMU